MGDTPGAFSFRGSQWSDIGPWKKAARGVLLELLHCPERVSASDVKVHARALHDGVEIEELSWQLPYGPRTGAYFLKPAGAQGRLPGVLAFHDHGGDKHFGKRKIARSAGELHPQVEKLQADAYGGAAWANTLARRGFAVLAHDVFPFETRKILAADLPLHTVKRLMSPPLDIREVTPEDLVSAPAMSFDVPAGEPEEQIRAYNAFGAQHESVIAKSLFSAGLTWPGVMVAEDRAALDYLASRPDVDAGRLGCGGLSGGGLRTGFLAGLDDRIRCAVCAGMMTTWRDYLLATSYTHSWMIFVPGLSGLLDFPEILGLGVPLPTCVLANTDDPLFTRAETDRACRMLEAIYHKAGAGERFHFAFYPGPHKFDVPMQRDAFDWFQKWLG
ncbi:MAG: prolyl oligopeptidase family serine peptidase [Spirochaetia bacterium]